MTLTMFVSPSFRLSIGAVAICTSLMLASPVAQSQTSAKPAASSASSASSSAVAAKAVEGPGWAVLCTASGRSAPATCIAEQKIVARETGQLISAIAVRVPGDTRKPVLVVQVPFGLLMSAGIKLQIDQGQSLDLAVETCESSGCYAVVQPTDGFLKAMAAGQKIDVKATSVSKEPFVATHALSGFQMAMQNIQ